MNILRLTIFFHPFEELAKFSASLGFHKGELTDFSLFSKSIYLEDFDKTIENNNRSSYFLGTTNNSDYTILLTGTSWTSLTYYLSKKVNCRAIDITISNDKFNPFYSYYIINNGIQERVIQLYKDENWVFHEVGTAKNYEDLSLYSQKLKKNRFNEEIIKQYLKQENIDLDELLKPIYYGILFQSTGELINPK